jgi:hypothetical protein
MTEVVLLLYDCPGQSGSMRIESCEAQRNMRFRDSEERGRLACQGCPGVAELVRQGVTQPPRVYPQRHRPKPPPRAKECGDYGIQSAFREASERRWGGPSRGSV